MQLHSVQRRRSNQSEINEATAEAPAGLRGPMWGPVNFKEPSLGASTRTVPVVNQPRERPVGCEPPAQGLVLQRSAGRRRARLLTVQERNRDKVSAFKVMHSKWMYPTGVALATYHGTNAAGQVCLTKAQLALAAANPAASGAMLGVFIGTWVTGHLMQYAIDNCMQMWKQEMHQRYSLHLVGYNQGRVPIWGDAAQRESLTRLAGEHSKHTLGAAVDSYRRLVDLSVGVVTQAATLSILINPVVGGAFLGGAVLATAFLLAAKAASSQRVKRCMNASEELAKHAPSFGDNVLLTNAYNRERWTEEYGRLIKELSDAERSSVQFGTVKNGVTTAILAAPLIGVMLGMMSLNPQAAHSVLSNIPTALRLLSNFQGLLNASLNEPIMRRMAESTINGAQSAKTEKWQNVLEKVSKNQQDFNITRDGQPVSFASLVENPDMLREPGRWTITAPNKTGKSALMLAIADYLQDDAFYLPTTSTLSFQNSTGSTAEIKMSHLQEVMTLGLKAKTILLDEWNANLDGKNRKLVNDMITEMASVRAVIEVLNISNDARNHAVN